MSEEWQIFLFVFISLRWIYLLAKRFKKPVVPHLAIALGIFLFGGIILALVISAVLLFSRGDGFVFNRLLTTLAFPLTGLIAVTIYYWIMLRIWKKESKTVTPNEDVLDDDLKL
jgi:hypothetical protein